ncbi:OmpP1/FadL family transporter [Geothrix fermentans]|uniref:OmpP1/FadL family transporter n=1 Tax=Geothrix fermentans TaxID=44676 RepID=UPI00041EAC3A|nr:outer membrane protein transport protein [Geothrix fermentans]
MPTLLPRPLVFLALAGMLQAQSPIGTLISEQSRTNFAVQGAGARAMGLGGAFIAVADDATAVSFNPAGLAQLLQPEVSFVARGVQHHVNYQDFETTRQGRVLAVSDAVTTNTRWDPLFVSATAPLRLGGRNLVLQLSIQRAFAQNEDSDRAMAETPVSGTLAEEGHLVQNINQSGQIDLYSAAVAYEVSQRILLGVAYNRWRGRWDLDSTSTWTSPTATTQVAYRQFNALDGDNFNLGLIWRWPTWSLGIVRRTGFHADYTFSTYLATSLAPGVRPFGPFATGLHWPASTGVGFAYRPGNHWLVTSDVTHTLWSSMRYMSSRASLNGQSFFDFDKGDRTPNATTAHLGVEYLWLTEGDAVIPLRAGLSREPQPVVDAQTGEQRVLYRASLGSGFKRGNTGLDLAYRYGWSRRQASQFLAIDQILSRTPPASVGTERIREHRLDLSFIYKFDRRPMERVLHYLFVGD